MYFRKYSLLDVWRGKRQIAFPYTSKPMNKFLPWSHSRYPTHAMKRAAATALLMKFPKIAMEMSTDEAIVSNLYPIPIEKKTLLSDF